MNKTLALIIVFVLFACAAMRALAQTAPAAASRPLVAGADVSMLPELEKLGAVYRRADGSTADAMTVLRENGCNLFRLRLFVNPPSDFSRNYGATQGLDYVVELARRIRAQHPGVLFLLDLHYSDTWADPGKQHKPAAWKGLDFDALEKQVHHYTAMVLKRLADAGATPDMVQVGNEIAGGMLWPDGKVLDAKSEDQPRQWERFVRLFNAGAKAVRAASTEEHPIRVVVHIHGGGREGMARWFFEKFGEHGADYDIAALSFYPAWSDRLEFLKQNMAHVAQNLNKDVLVAETSYPWKPRPEFADKPMPWPMTPQGQETFTRELSDAIRAVPGGRGMGFVWWYPEAVPISGRPIWREGAEGLFDENGRPLPALEAFEKIAREKR